VKFRVLVRAVKKLTRKCGWVATAEADTVAGTTDSTSATTTSVGAFLAYRIYRYLDTLIEDSKSDHPTNFPQFSKENPALGMSVGPIAVHSSVVTGQIGLPNQNPLFYGGWVARREKASKGASRFSLTP
jgi:hypothetical protein